MKKAQWIRRGMLLLLFVWCLYANSVAEEQKERLMQDGFEYELEEDGSARILGYTGEETELVVPSHIGNAVVVEIGKQAFAENQNVQSIAIEEGVQSIGDGAFQNCIALERMFLPGSISTLGESAFSGCTGLQLVNLPQGLENIGESCFSGSGLRKIKVPGSVEYVGRAAFYECGFMTEAEIEEGVLSLGAKAFSGCMSLIQVRLPESLRSLGAFAFERCGRMQRIDLGINLTTMGENPFVYCEALEEISIADGNTALVCNNGMLIDQKNRRLIACLPLKRVETCELPDDLIEIGGYAFAGCKRLSQVRIPQRLQVIGRGAFRGCSRLVAMEIPIGVEKIGTNPFEGCTGLSSLVISPKNRHFRYENGMLIDVDNRSIIAGFPNLLSSSVLIPDGIEHIGDKAFRVCVRMKELAIPDGVKTIGDYAFFECFKLERVYISSKLDSVGSNAFMDGQNYTQDITYRVELAFYGIDTTDSPMLYLEQEGAALDYAIAHQMNYLMVDPMTMAAMIQGEAWFEDSFENSLWRLENLAVFGGFEWRDENLLLYEDEDVQVTVAGLSFLNTGEALRGEKDDAAGWELGIQIIVKRRSQSKPSIQVSGNVYIDEYKMSGSLSESLFDRYYMVSVASEDPVSRIQKLSDVGEIVLPEIKVMVNGEQRALITQKSIEVSGRIERSICQANIGDGILEYIVDNEGLRIVGYSGAGKSVIIPEGIENQEFYSIDDGVFEHCERIKIPASIKSIGKKAVDNPGEVIVEVYAESYADVWAEEQGIKRIYTPSVFEKDGLIWQVLDEQILRVVGVSEDKETLEIPGEFKGMPVVSVDNLSGSALKKVIVGEGVQVIGKGAFEKSGELTEVILPHSLTEIGDSAFSECEKLHIISLPESLNSIGEKAFLNCRSIASISIGSGVVSIGKDAFSGMTGLAAIEVASRNPAYTSMNGVLFRKEDRALVLYPSAKEEEAFRIPMGIEYIEQNSIAQASCLKSIEIPSTVREIGDSVLQDMPQLETVVLNNGTERIGSHVLVKCPKVTRLVIPDSVRTIGNGSLSRMDSLRVCIFEDGVEIIGNNTLHMNPQLTLIHLPRSLREIGDGFADCDAENPVYIVVENGSYAHQLFDKETYFGHIWMVQKDKSNEQGMVEYEDEKGRKVYFCEQGGSIQIFIREAESVTLSRVCASAEGTVLIPDTVGGAPVTAIGDHAFKYAKQLTGIILPDSLRYVGKEAFSFMEMLTDIKLPEGIQAIGSDAFRGTGINCLTLPGALKVITEGLAAGIGSIQEVIIEEGVEEIRDGAFDFSFPAKVTLPASLENMSGAVFNARNTREFIVVKGSKAEKICKAYGYSYSYQGYESDSTVKSGEENEEIIFPSPEAEKIVRYALKKWEGPIYPDDVKGITEICFSGAGINSIEFLRSFTGLKRLCIGTPTREPEWSKIREVGITARGNNTFTDLSPISALKDLEELDLSFCDVKDLSPLTNLVNLKDLTLRYSHADDYSPLAALTNLERLVLWQSSISDISCLSGLEHLEYLNLMESKVTSLLPLGQLQNLRHLSLDECPNATDYEVLLDMPELEEIYCYELKHWKYREQLGDRLKL